LQANAKTTEGGQRPDRDAQFGYLGDQAQAHVDTKKVDTKKVDTKKKELVGAYKNDGREWSPAGEPVKVKVHDFIDPDLGKANPYGALRRRGRHRVGVGGHRPRHRAVRRGHHRALVDHRGSRLAPRGHRAADQRG